MKTFLLSIAFLALATANVIPQPKTVPIHHIQQWRDACPLCAAMMPIESDSILSLSSRITGGQTASIGQFPYQAYVDSAFGTSGNGICGGSLISTTWILTAAHCTDT